MGQIGWGELLIIFAIILLLVGGRRLPEIARSVGHAIRELQRSLRGGADEDDRGEGKMSGHGD